jgi:integrase/recombinase XerD
MLSKILGHSSVTVTEKAYLDVNKDDIKKSYQRYSPRENMKR